MITLFAIPKPFQGHTSIIQRNAIKSWLRVAGISEIILFGSDQGVAEAAVEFVVKHVPEIELNEFGTPLLNSAFNIVQRNSENRWIIYVNADIILPSMFCEAIKKIGFPQFLVSGRRLDVDILSEFDLLSDEASESFFSNARNNGKLHGYSGIDYFIFPRGQISMPAFAVGRPGWDNWVIWKCKSMKIPVIDASGMILVVHQNHDYSHSKFGTKVNVWGPEVASNIWLAGGMSNMLTLREADWILTSSGHLIRPSIIRMFLSYLSQYRLWLTVLALKRWIQSRLR
jgi:hypothetical protein